jgi:hypothetical protein
MLFGGFAAQQRFNPDADAAGSGSDNDEAAELLRLQPPGSEQELRADAAKLVEDNWPHITAIAEALLEDKTLVDGWEIIIYAIDEGEDWRSVWSQYKRKLL